MDSIRRSPTAPISRIGLAGLLASVAFAGSARASNTLAYSNGTFGAGMTSTKIVDTTPGASATFTSTTMPGGLPGAMRQTSHTFANGTILVAHVDPFVTYAPASEPLCMVDFAADLIHDTGTSVGGAVSYRLLALQGGNYYGGPSIDVFPNLWASYIQTGLTAADFTLFSGTGPSKPDFTCAGSPIQFGFITGNSSSSPAITKVSSIDNWLVTLHIAATTWTDPVLAASDWTSTKIFDSTPGALATTSSVSQAFGGSPGQYRETTHTYTNGGIIVFHEFAFGAHDPSIEPVYTVDFSADLNHLTGVSVGGAVAVLPAVRQGSGYYGATTINVFPNVWSNFVMNGQTATHFTLIGGSGPFHPDFTNSGALLHWGYMTGNSANGGPTTKTVGVDNWTVNAHLTPPCPGTLGTAACFGNDLGSTCPCYPVVPLGAPGRGCPNSIEPRGALLIATGIPSISNDTVILHGSGMPSSFCLYFQGTSLTRSLFGDGKLCMGGQITRLAVKLNICNSSQYPAGSEPSLSVQGSVLIPGTRHYQVWYRDSPTFCTAATFNLTNSLGINWLL